MGVEIERKFLLSDSNILEGLSGVPYRQGYIVASKGRVVRVRKAGGRGFLTIKSAKRGISRAEYEYEIPGADADEMLATLCSQPLIEKVRYRLPVGQHVWEIDVFSAANDGLIVAEVELANESEAVEMPAWVGREVSHDYRYTNSELVRRPYSSW